METNQQKYAIGDVGPAGGIVFFDKGKYTVGWQYLEAAPAKTEFKDIIWGAYHDDISGTKIKVGTGKRNTRLIVDYLKQTDDIGCAAQVCIDLDYKGFKDWFLPSIDELDLMYKNLKQNKFGRFGNNCYWCSSQNNSVYAFFLDFSTGEQDNCGIKKFVNCVRAIRAF